MHRVDFDAPDGILAPPQKDAAAMRARIVRQALIAAGLPGKRLVAEIVPLDAPPGDGETREARRRVTIWCETTSQAAPTEGEGP